MCCVACQGSKELVHYENIAVSFHSFVDDHLFNETKIPNKILERASGKVVFDETAPAVGKIRNFKINEISATISNMIDAHESKWPLKLARVQSQGHGSN